MQLTAALSAILLSLTVSSVAALPNGMTTTAETRAVLVDTRTGLPVPRMAKRDDPSIHDLLASCPKTNSKRLETANTCVWNKTGDNGGSYEKKAYYYQGTQRNEFTRNCQEGTTISSTITASGTSTVSETLTVSEEIGLDLGPFSFSASNSNTHTSDASTVNTASMLVSPGQKGALIGVQLMQPVTGTVQINYEDKQAGHYLWYVSGVNKDELSGDIQPQAYTIGCNDAEPTF